MFPDINLMLGELWGPGEEFICPRYFVQASNLVFGNNPVYGAVDFFAFHPKFAGNGFPLLYPVTLTGGSPVVTVSTTDGIAVGQLAYGTGIPDGATVTAISDSGTEITLSANTTADGSYTMSLYSLEALLVPLPVINAYIVLASASLVYARWKSSWVLGMGLWVAHHLTLWMRSDAGTFLTPGQVIASGLAQGIKVSKSAGAVSVGLQAVPGLEAWASWNETAPGVQFSTLARTMGAGPLLIY